VIMAETAHHPFMEKPAKFNQLVLDFLGSLKS
jgi:3-oxoadipate enol-lactonase